MCEENIKRGHSFSSIFALQPIVTGSNVAVPDIPLRITCKKENFGLCGFSGSLVRSFFASTVLPFRRWGILKECVCQRVDLV